MFTDTKNEQAKPMRFVFAKMLAWLFLAVSLVLLASIYWRAGINPENPQATKVFKYYYLYCAIYGFSIIFWGVALRLRDETRLRLVLMACALSIGFYIVELALFVYGPPKSRDVIAKEAGIYFDNRSKFEVIQDLRKNGVDAVPPLFPSYFYDSSEIAENGEIPLLPLNISVGGKTVVYCNEGGEYMVYQSDRYGFNNPDSEWEAKSTQWIVTGDSFVHGACVKTGEDIAGQIRRQTGETTLNLGSGDSGPPLGGAGKNKGICRSQSPKTGDLGLL